MRSVSVLAIDDSRVDLDRLEDNLAACPGYTVRFRGFQNWKRGLRALTRQDADIIFLNSLMGNVTGLQVLDQLRGRGDMRPVIMLAREAELDQAIEGIRRGASDILSKDRLGPDLLAQSIGNARESYTNRVERALVDQEQRTARHLEAIGTLAGGVAHDFNNFLAGILSSAELAQTYPADPKVYRELDRIVGVVDHATHLIRRLLKFNRYYAGDGHPERLDLREVVRDTLTILEHSRPPGIEIVLESDDMRPLPVIGSSSALHRALLNLCVNGIEAMDQGGTLRIRILRENPPDSELAESAAGGSAQVTITDEGPGIPAEVRLRVFEPFFTTKRLDAHKGRGLGLADVWECVRSMKGSICVQDAQPHGTTFQIRVPLVANPDPDRPRSRSSDIRGDECLLLVDDRPEVRCATAELLRRLGYTVHARGGGGEALDLLNTPRSGVALVILDLSMPEIDGKDTLRRLRAVGNPVPILMTTGHTASFEREELTRLGASDIVQKPYSIRQLAASIRSLLNSEPPEPD